MAAKKKAARKATAGRRAARRSTAKRARGGRATAKGLKLSSVAPSLTVNDIEQSFKWYCDVLGFVITERWVHEGVLRGGEIAAGGVRLFLGQDDWQKGRDRVKGEGVRIYCRTVQDIDQLAASIKARGGTLASEPRDEYGMRAFNLVDPSGYKITISSQR
jgi:predicted enzyme related to lactoylglutathione lyase